MAELHRLTIKWLAIITRSPGLARLILSDLRWLLTGLTLRDVFFDNPGVHPNDLGMQYIADFIIEVLDSVYAHLPADTALQEVDMTLPEPLLSDVFTNTYTFTPATLVPSGNEGWKIDYRAMELRYAGC